MKNNRRWDDYGAEPHEGWIQVGNIDGSKYSCWVERKKGFWCVISRGNDMFSDELGNYLVQIDDRFYDFHETFEEAENQVLEELEKLENE